MILSQIQATTESVIETGEKIATLSSGAILATGAVLFIVVIGGLVRYIVLRDKEHRQEINDQNKAHSEELKSRDEKHHLELKEWQTEFVTQNDSSVDRLELLFKTSIETQIASQESNEKVIKASQESTQKVLLEISRQNDLMQKQYESVKDILRAIKVNSFENIKNV